MIYLAPIQGFTDFVYRSAYSEVFSDMDAFFIPYITVKDNQLPKKYNKEILPQNNPQNKVIPQVLVKDTSEIIFLSKILEDFGYSEINLNLGCPYPMATNRGKGSGLLPYPEKIKIILESFFEHSNLKLSVKLRAGLISTEEIEKIIPILNQFPLTEVILHPRVAKQLYKGIILESAFEFASQNAKHRLVYNGDIFELSDFIATKQKFPETNDWMLGRGVLSNPFLPSEINGLQFSPDEKWNKLNEFHQLVLENYSEVMDNPGNVLNKMVQFWSYFSYNFPNQKKVFKSIKKSKNLGIFNLEVKKAFLSLN
jgi:tRNA-dihydrouridine synthase B